MRIRDTNKQQRIKEAVVQLILREGFGGISMNKIAKEAEVSPATIYIYYENKDQMLSDIFRDYANRVYDYLFEQIRPDMDGKELIDTLIRGYADYISAHAEEFGFVEQCSRCPTLAGACSEKDGTCKIFDLLHSYQQRSILKPFCDVNIAAVLFYPVRFVAMDQSAYRQKRLNELIDMMQELLLYP